MPEYSLKNFVQRMILKDELELNLPLSRIPSVAKELKAKHNLFPCMNLNTFISQFLYTYNKLSAELKIAEKYRSPGQQKRAKKSLSVAELVLPQKTKRKTQTFLTVPLKNGPVGLTTHRTVLVTGPPGAGKRTLVRAAVFEAAREMEEIRFVQLLALLEDEQSLRAKTFFERLKSHVFCVLVVSHVFLEKSRSALTALSVFVAATRNLFFVFVTENTSDVPLSLLVEMDLCSSEIAVPLPQKVADRKQLLQLFVKEVVSDTVLDTITDQSQQFSPRDLFLLVKNARLEVASVGRSSLSVSGDELLRAFEELKSVCRKEGFTDLPRCSFADVGGLAKAKALLRRRVLLPLKYSTTSASVGLLFFGPPGCGKTLLARALAAETRASFLLVKGPELVSQYLGESERAVRALFARARAAAPALVFFDEVDALALRRGTGQEHGSLDRLVNQLLTEMDALALSNGPPVFVVGATNRPEHLDSAFLRQGRLGTKVFIGKPTAVEREQIWAVCRKQYILTAEADAVPFWCDKHTAEFTGADISEVFKNAHLRALDELDQNKETGIQDLLIKKCHLVEAIEEVKNG